MLRAGLVFVIMLTNGAALAQAYPSKPIRFIVPYAPGAINDMVARTLGQKMAETFGKPVVVDNRPGAGTIVGTEIAARSPADGHTLLLVSVAHSINPALRTDLSFDVLRDFTPVTLVGFAPFVLVVNPSMKVASTKELIALAKAQPGKLTYGSSGNGGGAHLAMEMLKSVTGTNINHVPYKGAAPAITEVISGQIHMTMATVVAVGAHVKAGRLRAIAVSSKQRYSAAPDLPTIAEACCANYDATPWWGVAVPAGTPKAIVEQLNATILKILRMPDIVERFTSQGVDLTGSTSAAAAAHLKEQTARWTKVVKEAGVKVQ
jgi:tripartite-type tricarboxylate transporter receptor subunit TctC